MKSSTESYSRKIFARNLWLGRVSAESAGRGLHPRHPCEFTARRSVPQQHRTTIDRSRLKHQAKSGPRRADVAPGTRYGTARANEQKSTAVIQRKHPDSISNESGCPELRVDYRSISRARGRSLIHDQIASGCRPSRPCPGVLASPGSILNYIHDWCRNCDRDNSYRCGL